MRKLARTVLAALLLAGATSAAAIPFTGLTVFGDSLSDTGNAGLALGAVTTPPFALIPSAPYARPGPLWPALSNGPIWAEFVASALNLPPDPAGRPLAPALAGGTGFAFGGADSGPLPGVPPSGSPTLLDQFGAPALFGGGPVVRTDLYAVWGGGNDVRRALAVYQTELTRTGDPGAAFAAASAVIAGSVTNLSTLLRSLAAAGAQHILSLNVPDLGVAPAITVLGPEAAALATGLSASLNSGLGMALDAIESDFSIHIVELDVFTVLQQLVADPGAFGLVNATDPCLQIGGSGLCADPGSFLFWDGIHPTSAGHQRIAAAVLSALVPAPRTLALVCIGLLAWLAAWRLSQR